MKVGYLHLGSDSHGVKRYGKIIADAVDKQPEINIQEWDMGNGFQEHRIQEINQWADIVHCQYNAQVYSSIWGKTWRQVSNLKKFFNLIKIPVVFTLHDLYSPGYLSQYNNFSFGEWVKAGIAPYRRALKIIRKFSSGIHVNSEEEQRRLFTLGVDQIPTVIPHFVEKRILPSKQVSRSKLAFDDRNYALLLGYIHPRKGHDIAVKMMHYLPKDFILIIVGDAIPRFQSYKQDLLRIARKRGYEDRVYITGRISEEQLNLYLAATDMAVCPFRNVSASGSVSTIISSGLPLVVSGVPLFDDYQYLVPGSLAIVKSLSPEKFAIKMMDVFTNRKTYQTRLNKLQQRLIPATLREQFINMYKAIK